MGTTASGLSLELPLTCVVPFISFLPRVFSVQQVNILVQDSQGSEEYHCAADELEGWLTNHPDAWQEGAIMVELGPHTLTSGGGGCLSLALEDYPLTDIFPELIGRETDNRTLARAHNCLGDIMRVCNHDYVLARAQYAQSLRYWRDIRNPALRNGFLNLVLTRGYIWARRLAADLVRSWKMGWRGQPVYWNIDCISASNAIQCPQL